MPLRLRLAIWNALVIAAAMALLGALTYVLEARSLEQEIDESLRSQVHNLTTVYQVRATMSPRARERIMPQPSVFSAPAFHVQVLDPEGEIVERSAGLGARRLPIDPTTLRRAGEDEEVFETLTLDGQDVRLYTVPLVTDDEFLGYIQVARSLEALQDALEFLRQTLLIAGAILLVVSMAMAWLLAGVSLRPINRITQAARDVSLSGRLDRRLSPVRTRDELARLVDTFNRMMDRLEGAFTAQRRFVADASHELRTPLTTIRGNLELLRRSGAVSHPDMQEALDDVTAEALRMSRLVDGLLALARADAGQELAKVPVRLDRLAREVRREMQPLAQDVDLAIGNLERAEVIGDRDALKQLILILVDNGIKYTPRGGSVTLGVRFEGDEAVLTVGDTGSGIAPADLPHIFERFYRSATARGSGGTGLGLAIARWIAERHGARIEVDSRVGSGTTFSVRMSATRAARRPSDEPAARSPELAASA